MKNLLLKLSLIVLCSTGLSVIMDPEASSDEQVQQQVHRMPPHHQFDETRNFNEALRSCFAKRSYGTLECVNRGALSALQSWNDDDCLDFGDVKLERSDGESRNILDLEWDPKDFGSVVKAASRLLERRNVKWDLGNIYPGLQMRVGPTLSAENGMLEFVMDERSHHYHNRQLGTGRLLVRQLVLPFLLGFKFNLASLLPLLFGVLIVVTKKALLLTKVALFIAGLLGWNSIVGGYAGGGAGYPNGGNGIVLNQGYGNGGGGGGILNPGDGGGLGSTILQDPSYQFHPYRGLAESTGFPFGQHVIRELVNVYESASNQEPEEPDRRKKKFVWSRNES